MINNEDKTYMINGQKVDGFGEPIETQKKSTKAKIVPKAIGLALVISLGLTAVTGAIVKTKNEEPQIIATVTSNPENEETKYQIITAEGKKLALTKYELPAIIESNDYISINGTYYSKTPDNLVVITTTLEVKQVVSAVEKTIYTAPAGWMLVGNKCYKSEHVIEATKIVDESGNITYCAPAGYILEGTKAIKFEGWSEATQAEKTTIYIVPTGYTLVGDKGIKKVYREKEFAVTKEEYESKDFNINDRGIGIHENYTAVEITPEPIESLLVELGIELTEQKKLTK